MKVVSTKFVVSSKLKSLQTLCIVQKTITRNWLSKIATLRLNDFDYNSHVLYIHLCTWVSFILFNGKRYAAAKLSLI